MPLSRCCPANYFLLLKGLALPSNWFAALANIALLTGCCCFRQHQPEEDSPFPQRQNADPGVQLHNEERADALTGWLCGQVQPPEMAADPRPEDSAGYDRAPEQVRWLGRLFAQPTIWGELTDEAAG